MRAAAAVRESREAGSRQYVLLSFSQSNPARVSEEVRRACLPLSSHATARSFFPAVKKQVCAIRLTYEDSSY